jgi:hypothetical protein
MKWYCFSRMDATARQDMELMQQSGWMKAFLGLESVSNPAVLRRRTPVPLRHFLLHRRAAVPCPSVKSRALKEQSFPGAHQD